MFFKKKDKGGEPPKGKQPEPPRDEVRRPEPPRQQAPQPQPQPSRVQPQAPAPQQPARAGAGAAIDTALVKARAYKGAPVSPDSTAAQSRAADQLASSNENVERGVAKDLASGAIDKGFDALQSAAQVSGPLSESRWRLLGALAFNIDAGRSKFAYENLFNFQPRQFWDCIFLARLRGIGQQMDQAIEATNAALSAAANDRERAMARGELGLIAVAMKDFQAAVGHAETAIALGKAAGDTGRDHVVRLVLLGDAATGVGDMAKARKALAEALDAARRLGAAAPTDSTLARGVCEVMEKNAAAAAVDNDHAAAATTIDEAINIRRRLASVLTPVEASRGLAQTLSLKGELRRMAGDMAGARTAFEESLGLVRKIGEANPADVLAQRDHWGTMWRMASIEGAGVDWRQVVSTMEKMQAAGGLDQEGRKFLEEGRRRLAA